MSSEKLPTADTVVLLVDEDVIVRLSIAEYLRGCGINVIETANADEARIIASTGEPVSVVLCDAQLSGEGGFAFAQWMRRRRPDAAVILLPTIAAKTKAASDLCDQYGPREKLCDHGTLTTRIQALRAKRLRNSRSPRAVRGLRIGARTRRG